MNDIEKALLQELTGDAALRLCLRTKTRVDAGRWWRRVPLWLCVTDKQLVLFSVARRRYVQRVDLQACSASSYCHASGALVLRPVEGLEFDHIVISPADALKVLAFIQNPDVGEQESGVSEQVPGGGEQFLATSVQESV